MVCPFENVNGPFRWNGPVIEVQGLIANERSV